MVLRVKFSKHGAVRFIGHLDVMRFFQKTIRRAEIDVAYTNGFSPHQAMSFAQPLSVGHESNGEYMDIEVNSITSCDDIKEKLNKASVPGIEILSIKVLMQNSKNAMASVAAAKYTVCFRDGREPDFINKTPVTMSEAVDRFLLNKEVLITKEGKSGPREVDIRPGIYDLSWVDGSGQGKGYFSMLVDASSSGNIKPVQIIGALLRDYGEELKENALMVTREDTYMYTGDKENRKLVPLDACE